MSYDEYRRLLPRQLAIIDGLNPRSRSQVDLIDTMRSTVRQIESNLELADSLEGLIQALWRQLDELQGVFASLTVEQRPGCEDTAEIDLAELAKEQPLDAQPAPPEDP